MRTGLSLASGISSLGIGIAGFIVPNFMKIEKPYSDYILAFGLCLTLVPWLFWGFKAIGSMKDRSGRRVGLSQGEIEKKINEINILISLGETTKKNSDKMRSASVYVFEEMKDLKYGTLSLLSGTVGKESYLYQEAMKPPDFGINLSPRALYATKLEFIDHYVSLLKSLAKEIRVAPKGNLISS